MAEVIKFAFDQPVEVALRFAEPKIFPSNYPGGDDRHMFSTTDGRVMYLDALTAAKIKSLGVAVGEVFSICKRKQGRITDYLVFRDSEEPAAEPAPAPAAPRGVVQFGGTPKTYPPQKSGLPERLYHSPDGSLEDQLRASIDMVERKKLEARMNELPPAKPVAAETRPQDRWKQALLAQTNALTDVLADALRHSAQHGGIVDKDAVRSLLITAFIQLSKQDRAA